MDRFDLNWPKTDAIFYTDGWRCRIVWRQKGGIGGTIDNNVQCVRRVAESLEGAPYLLSAIKARGHARLAAMIEAEQPELQTEAQTPEPAARPAVAQREHAKPQRVARKDTDTAKRPRAAAAKADRLTAWLDLLDGDAAWEAASNRRSRQWHEIGGLGDEALQLKTPAAKGKQEWVLKRSWPEEGRRKAEYVAAVNFRGIAGYLQQAKADATFIEGLFKAMHGEDHAELKSAAEAWRRSSGGRTH